MKRDFVLATAQSLNIIIITIFTTTATTTTTVNWEPPCRFYLQYK